MIYEPEFPVYILVPAIERVPVLLIVIALAVPLILMFVPAVIVFFATVTAWPLTVTPPTTVASAAAALPPLKLGELKVIEPAAAVKVTFVPDFKSNVLAAEPLNVYKSVPSIVPVLDFNTKLLAVLDALAAVPLILIFQVPEAFPPVKVGEYVL